MDGPVTEMTADNTSFHNALSGRASAHIAIGHHSVEPGPMKLHSTGARYLPLDVHADSVRHTTLAGVSDADHKAAGFDSHEKMQAFMSENHENVSFNTPVTVIHFTRAV